MLDESMGGLRAGISVIVSPRLVESLETTGTTKEAEDVKRAERNDAINLTAKQSFTRERAER